MMVKFEVTVFFQKGGSIRYPISAPDKFHAIAMARMKAKDRWPDTPIIRCLVRP